MNLWPFTHPRLTRPATPAEAARTLAHIGHAKQRQLVLSVADQMRRDTEAGRVANGGRGW